MNFFFDKIKIDRSVNMLCKKCGFENIDGSKFCVKCGSDLVESQIETINFAPNNAESIINN